MKRKFFTALVIAAGLSLTACQEDTTMDELIQDTELNQSMDDGVDGTGTGSGGSGSQGGGNGGVGGSGG